MEPTNRQFEEWWPKAEGRIRTECARMGFPDADDVIQQVAYSALLRIRGEQPYFNDADHLARWSAMAARWLIIDQLRFCQRTSRFRRLLSAKRPMYETATPQSHQMASELYRLVESLPDRQREALLGKVRGEPTESTAARMGITPAAVRSLRRFATKRIAEQLEATDERRKDEGRNNDEYPFAQAT